MDKIRFSREDQIRWDARVSTLRAKANGVYGALYWFADKTRANKRRMAKVKAVRDAWNDRWRYV